MIKSFKQIREDVGAIAANNTGAMPDKLAVDKKKQIRYKNKNAEVNSGGRKIKALM